MNPHAKIRPDPLSGFSLIAILSLILLSGAISVVAPIAPRAVWILSSDTYSIWEMQIALPNGRWHQMTGSPSEMRRAHFFIWRPRDHPGSAKPRRTDM
jgi:hypothetical protein